MSWFLLFLSVTVLNGALASPASDQRNSLSGTFLQPHNLTTFLLSLSDLAQTGIPLSDPQQISVVLRRPAIIVLRQMAILVPRELKPASSAQQPLATQRSLLVIPRTEETQAGNRGTQGRQMVIIQSDESEAGNRATQRRQLVIPRSEEIQPGIRTTQRRQLVRQRSNERQAGIKATQRRQSVIQRSNERQGDITATQRRQSVKQRSNERLSSITATQRRPSVIQRSNERQAGIRTTQRRQSVTQRSNERQGGTATTQRRPSVITTQSGQAAPALSQTVPDRKQPRCDGTKSDAVMESCLGCICEATTLNCNMTVGCVDGEYCGPFLISRPYWVDAGRCVLRGDNPSRKQAFRDCIEDPYCAARTVRSYMRRLAKDCNNDGRIDCDDFARMHRLGGYGCRHPSVENTQFYRIFTQCWKDVQRLG